MLDTKVVSTPKRVVVSLGRAPTLTSHTPDYQYLMTLGHMLVNEMFWGEFERVTFTGPAAVLKRLQEQYECKRCRYEVAEQDRFQELVNEASLVILPPGLDTPLQVFSKQLPVIFLPPFNSSQYEQLTHYRVRGCATLSIHLSDFYSQLALVGKTPEESEAEFTAQLRRFQTDTQALIKTGAKLNDWINNPNLWQRQVEAQNEYLASI
jgi:hypothetical protein